MYLSEVRIKNFRCFDETEHLIKFRPDINVLVGENDSGKTAVIDAIRIVLGTTDQGWYRIELSDFHNEDKLREISIICHFEDLTDDESAAFLECITYQDSHNGLVPNLFLYWTSKYLHHFLPPRVSTSISTGLNGDGPAPSSVAKELLRVTYLRALRDAYNDMQSGKNSRLSQIIQSVPNLNAGEHEYSDGMDLQKLSIAGIADLSNKLLKAHPSLSRTSKNVTDIMQNSMLLNGDILSTELQVAGIDTQENKRFISLLEKLDLATIRSEGQNRGRVGLGTSNILSMACEMLLNNTNAASGKSSFLLIEEPEAHIHAQRQLRLIQSLQNEATQKSHQVIITTHSPLLASVVELENIVILNKTRSYSLAKDQTLLCENDYEFLSRYLDATKANLFFAKSVVIVEGPAEELLLPTISRIIDRDFTKFGVSIVNVLGIGLRRYAKILQRKNSSDSINIPVACITDRDIMPDCAPAICIDERYKSVAEFPKKSRRWKVESEFDSEEKVKHISDIKIKADGQNVKTFVSDHWTLEYDLFYSGLDNEMIEALVAIKYPLKDIEIQAKKLRDEIENYPSIEAKSAYFYSCLLDGSISKAEFAQTLASVLLKYYSTTPETLLNRLPKYLVNAIGYVTKELEFK